MATGRDVSRKFRGVAVVITIGLTVAIGAAAIPFLMDGKIAEADPAATPTMEERIEQRKQEYAKRKAERQAKREKHLQEMEQRRQEQERERQLADQKRQEEIKKMIENSPPPSKRVRKVRRYQWESPAKTRSRLWNIPEEEQQDATVEGLLRICTSEQEGSEDDCVGIWQVLTNIRSRSCNREWIRKITECDENGETMLSTMRRASRYVLGVVKPRSRRQQWIANMDLTCDMPDRYPHGEKNWEKRHRHHCEATAKLARGLIDGSIKKSITGVRVITWGGRCEVKTGACDDPIACERGLARVPGLETKNAFWCLPGKSFGCSDDIDPICLKLGFPSLRKKAVSSQEDVQISKTETQKSATDS